MVGFFIFFSCFPGYQFAILVWIWRSIRLSGFNLAFCVHALFLNFFGSSIPPVLSPWTSPEMRLYTIMCFMFLHLLNPHRSFWLLSLLLLLHLCYVWQVVQSGGWVLELLTQIRQVGRIINGISGHMSILQYVIEDKLGHLLSNISTCFFGVLVAAICY